jgi:hypothetical protein
VLCLALLGKLGSHGRSPLGDKTSSDEGPNDHAIRGGMEQKVPPKDGQLLVASGTRHRISLAQSNTVHAMPRLTNLYRRLDRTIRTQEGWIGLEGLS